MALRGVSANAERKAGDRTTVAVRWAVTRWGAGDEERTTAGSRDLDRLPCRDALSAAAEPFSPGLRGQDPIAHSRAERGRHRRDCRNDGRGSAGRHRYGRRTRRAWRDLRS